VEIDLHVYSKIAQGEEVMMVLAIRVGTVDYQEDSSALNLDHSPRRMRICDGGGGEVVGTESGNWSRVEQALALSGGEKRWDRATVPGWLVSALK